MGGELSVYVHGEEVDISKENADEVFRCKAALTISINQGFRGGLRGERGYVRFVEK